MTAATRFRQFSAAAMIAALAVVLGAASAASGAGAATITCTNPASGASWQVAVDPQKATVDANPARFSPGEISWYDPKDGGRYTLDRRSGELVASIASSTGGYFRRARCNLGNAK